MSTNNPTDHQNTELALPSPAQIALAILVVRSKPQDVSIDDYIAYMHQSVVGGTRPAPVAEVQHFDANKLWKKMYEKAQVENVELRNRNFELEQDIRTCPSHPTDSPSGWDRKRRYELPVTLANTQSKRLKTEPAIEYDGIELDGLESSNVTPGIRTLLRAILTLRISIKTSKRPELLSAIRLVCQAAKLDLLQIEHTKEAGIPFKNQRPRTEIWEICNYIDLAYPSMLHALSGLDAVKLPKISLKAGQCNVVDLYVCLLESLQRIAIEEVYKKDEEQKEKEKKPRSNTKVVQKAIGNSKNSYSFCGLTVAKTLTRLITDLSITNTSHTELLNGLLATFLDHLGGVLSVLVFTDPEIPLREQSGLLPPSGLSKLSHVDTSIAIAAARLEGFFLAHILRKVMMFLHENANSESRSAAIVTKFISLNGETTELGGNIRATLQRTLLKGVFGGNDKAFKESLAKPIRPDTMGFEEMAKQMKKHENSSEWVIGQIWEHLGWDILSNEAGVLGSYTKIW